MLSGWHPTLFFFLAQTWDAVDVFLIFSNRSPCCQHIYLTRLFERNANQHQIMNPHQPWILRIWSIRPQELGYEPTLSGLSSLNGDMVASSCRRTLTTLIQVCLDSSWSFWAWWWLSESEWSWWSMVFEIMVVSIFAYSFNLGLDDNKIWCILFCVR